jgi:glycosyltransferase involved in cell wall biosynthesis
MRQCNLLACIVPVWNEAKIIESFIKQLHEFLSDNPDLCRRFEVIVVNDGSKDDTADRVAQLCDMYPETLTLVDLSRNFGKEKALTAGLDYAVHADAVVMLDGDFQHPFEVIKDFVRIWQTGIDMVYGVRENHHNSSRIHKFLGYLFYKLMAYMAEVPLPRYAGDFRLLDKKVVKALNALPEKSRFMKGLYAWVGYSSQPVLFTVPDRPEGTTSSWRFGHLLDLAFKGITGFSTMPLRFLGWTGAGVASIAFLYALIIITKTLLFGVRIPGYASLIVAVTFFGGVQLIAIGVLGEYIARIYEEVKGRPAYLVKKLKGKLQKND